MYIIELNKVITEGGLFIENLKKLRTERGLSQQKLAEKFNISQQAIYKYENNLTEPDIQTMKNLALFFHTSVDYLIGYEQENIDKKTKLTSKETHLIDTFRKLSPDMQEHILAIMEELISKK